MKMVERRRRSALRGAMMICEVEFERREWLVCLYALALTLSVAATWGEGTCREHVLPSLSFFFLVTEWRSHEAYGNVSPRGLDPLSRIKSCRAEYVQSNHSLIAVDLEKFVLRYQIRTILLVRFFTELNTCFRTYIFLYMIAFSRRKYYMFVRSYLY
jgi:hypothetical protein